MFITFTTSKVTPEQLQEIETFLHEFLPRLKQQPGVLAIYHCARAELRDEITIIIWENEEAVQAYRKGNLIKEAIAFEQAHHLPSTREGYPLIYPQ
jgi:heme-degrading monooxygenase HmoA